MLNARKATDADLVHAVVRGETRRFATLVERYQNMVYSVLLARVRDEHQADDLAQETFLSAYRHLAALDDPRRFGPWLRRIAENQALSYLRAAAVRRRVDDKLIPLPAPAQAPDSRLEEEDAKAALWRALDQLSDDAREVVLLHYMEDHPQQRIADFLDIPLSAVKARLRRARAALKEALRERQLRGAVGDKRRTRAFRRRILAALPLVPWAADARPWSAVRIGLGVLVVAGLLGVGGYVLRPWQDRAEEGSPAPARVRLASAEEYQRFVDQQRFAEPLENTPSIFGTAGLGAQAKQTQQRALERGWGGRLEWDFADGAQGWQARTVGLMGIEQQSELPIAARDGVLRVPLGRDQGGRATIKLISPELGYDARLFDRLEARVRIDHDRPLPGQFALYWTNPLNRLTPGAKKPPMPDPNGPRKAYYSPYSNYARERPTYTPSWQTLAIEPLDRRPPIDRPADQVHAPPLQWRGELIDLRLFVGIGEYSLPPGTALPRAVEIDRIALIGRQEPIQDLPAPAPTVPAASSGTWLSAGAFFPLDQYGVHAPSLGDLDADGDLDLVVNFLQHYPADHRTVHGWATAYNDGAGRFSPGRSETWERDGEDGLTDPAYFYGADIDGDARMDMLVKQGRHTRLLHNQGDGHFARGRHWPNEYYIGVGDVDGDGDLDIATKPYDEQRQALPGVPVRLHLNDGDGFRPHDLRTDENFSPYALGDFDGDGRGEMLWSRYDADHAGERVRIWDDCCLAPGARPEITVAFAPPIDVYGYDLRPMPLYLGDIDGDGRWDLGQPLGTLRDNGYVTFGLRIARQQQNGDAELFLPRRHHLYHDDHDSWLAAQVHDFDGDGLSDPVFLDVNYRAGHGLLILRGRRGELPAIEGRYLLPARPRGWSAGDLDADGDADVAVVVEGAAGPGIYVLYNTIVRKATSDER